MMKDGIKQIIRTGQFPGIAGTSVGFNNGKRFIHEDNEGRKSELTNWKDWERAGYKDPLSFVKDKSIINNIKRKIDKCKNFDTGKRRTL